MEQEIPVPEKGKIVNVMCPRCGAYQQERVVEKTTSVCRSGDCRFPVDVYEDGTHVASPLALCRGEVEHDWRGLGLRRPSLRTLWQC